MNKHKRIIISIVVAIVVVVVAFILYNLVGTNKVKNSINSSITSTLLPNIKDFYKVKQTVKLNNISMIVDRIEISNGLKIEKPDEGEEYIILTVTIKNGSRNKIRYDDDDFQIQDAKGNVTNSVVTMIDANQTFKNGHLAPNGRVTGTMTFLAVKGATGLSLNYNGNLFGHSVIHFKLN